MRSGNSVRDHLKAFGVGLVPGLAILGVLWAAVGLIGPTHQTMTELTGNAWTGAVLGALLWYGSISVLCYGLDRVASAVNHEIITPPYEETPTHSAWSGIGAVCFLFSFGGFAYAILPVMLLPLTYNMPPTTVNLYVEATARMAYEGTTSMIFFILCGVFLAHLDQKFNNDPNETRIIGFGPFPCWTPPLRKLLGRLSNFIFSLPP